MGRTAGAGRPARAGYGYGRATACATGSGRACATGSGCGAGSGNRPSTLVSFGLRQMSMLVGALKPGECRDPRSIKCLFPAGGSEPSIAGITRPSSVGRDSAEQRHQPALRSLRKSRESPCRKRGSDRRSAAGLGTRDGPTGTRTTYGACVNHCRPRRKRGSLTWWPPRLGDLGALHA
jgi:hypothetical protein